jgi:hypothetical protein
VVALPLAVVALLKLPQEELPQLTDHFTPPFDESFVTLAVRLIVLEICSEDAGCEAKETDIEAGGFGLLPVPELQPTLSITITAAARARRQRLMYFIANLQRSLGESEWIELVSKRSSSGYLVHCGPRGYDR